MSRLSWKTQRAFDSLILGQRPAGRQGWRLIFGRKLEQRTNRGGNARAERGAAEDSRDEFRHTWRLRQDGTRRDNADIGPGKYGGKVDELSIPREEEEEREEEQEMKKMARGRKITPVDKLSEVRWNPWQLSEPAAKVNVSP